MWSPKTTATWSFGPKYRAWQPMGQQNMYEDDAENFEQGKPNFFAFSPCDQDDLIKGSPQLPTNGNSNSFLMTSTQSYGGTENDQGQEHHSAWNPWQSTLALNPEPALLKMDEVTSLTQSCIPRPILQNIHVQNQNPIDPFLPLNRTWHAGMSSPLQETGGRVWHVIQPAATSLNPSTPVKNSFDVCFPLIDLRAEISLQNIHPTFLI